MRFLRRQRKQNPAPISKADNDMDVFVERLRTEHGLDQEPTDLSPKELKAYRRETAKVKEEVLDSFGVGYDEAAGMKQNRRKRRPTE